MMTPRIAGLITLLSLAAAGAVSLNAQGTAQDSLTNAIELMRSNVRANKADLIGRSLALPDSQATVFWPMYREYEAEFGKLADDRVALIKEYLVAYDTLSDAKAKDLMQRMYDLEARRVKVSRDTFNRFSKKLPAKTVAHFLQIDGFLNRVIDLQIAAALPEVK
jgi:hypothetical protein